MTGQAAAVALLAGPLDGGEGPLGTLIDADCPELEVPAGDAVVDAAHAATKLVHRARSQDAVHAKNAAQSVVKAQEAFLDQAKDQEAVLKLRR